MGEANETRYERAIAVTYDITSHRIVRTVATPHREEEVLGWEVTLCPKEMFQGVQGSLSFMCSENELVGWPIGGEVRLSLLPMLPIEQKVGE